MTGFVDTSHASPDVIDRDMPTRGGGLLTDVLDHAD